MRRIKSLNMALVLFVFIIMTIASTISGASFFMLAGRIGFGRLAFASQYPQTLFMLLFSILIGTVLSIAISNVFLRPLTDLIHATKRVAKGDFTVRVPGRQSPGEIGELIDSFNSMTHDLGGIELFRKDFINNFSHEFKTPIVSIRGFAKQLERDDLTDAQRREYTSIIVSESERLANMSSNVLLLTKLENQQILADRAEYSLDEQLRRSILLLENKWSPKGIEFALDLDRVIIDTNEEIVSHIWINLIGNAIKFSPDNGEVGVSCRLDGGRAVVEVSDRGIGMDAATQARIFEKFYQGDHAHATEGNGLGLSLVKRIVELCGGTLSVDSAPGAGSRFTVCLPIK